MKAVQELVAYFDQRGKLSRKQLRKVLEQNFVASDAPSSMHGLCDNVGTTYYFFRGSQVVTAEYYQKTGTPQPIAVLFPLLPDSFKLGVTAAVNIGGTLYLVKGGWYLPADGSAPRAKLTDLKGWPKTPSVWRRAIPLSGHY